MPRRDQVRERAQPACRQVSRVELVPAIKPPGPLLWAEWFQPQRDHPFRVPGPVGHRDPARHQHYHRPAVIRLALLEAGHPDQVVGLAHAGSLQQLIEPVEQHDGHRPVGCPGHSRPVRALARRCPDRVLDLVLNVGLSGCLTQHHPDRHEVDGWQPGRQHLRQHRLASSRLAKHDQRSRCRIRRRQHPRQVAGEVRPDRDVVPPGLIGGHVPARDRADPEIGIKIPLLQRRQADSRRCLTLGQDRPRQRRPVRGRQRGSHIHRRPAR